jgi:hypothetical protein
MKIAIMKVSSIFLLIIIGSCLAKSTLNEPFYQYGRGEDYYSDMFVSNECPCLSCIDQPCASPYKP